MNKTKITPIEAHLLHAVCNGQSNKEIAANQGKSEHTVRNQLAVLFKKLGVSNRTLAAQWFQNQKAQPPVHAALAHGRRSTDQPRQA